MPYPTRSTLWDDIYLFANSTQISGVPFSGKVYTCAGTWLGLPFPSQPEKQWKKMPARMLSQATPKQNGQGRRGENPFYLQKTPPIISFKMWPWKILENPPCCFNLLNSSRRMMVRTSVRRCARVRKHFWIFTIVIIIVAAAVVVVVIAMIIKRD